MPTNTESAVNGAGSSMGATNVCYKCKMAEKDTVVQLDSPNPSAQEDQAQANSQDDVYYAKLEQPGRPVTLVPDEFSNLATAVNVAYVDQEDYVPIADNATEFNEYINFKSYTNISPF